MIRKYLYPDFYFDEISRVTPELLTANGIAALICDIDNTLVTYDDPVPTEKVRGWFERLTASGIAIAFVSNNTPERVELFSRETGYFASGDSGKPMKRELIRAMEHMKSSAKNTAVLGDQLFTDVFSGRRIGLRAILVDPIKDKLTPSFRFKRALERPILRGYKKRARKIDGGYFYARNAKSKGI